MSSKLIRYLVLAPLALLALLEIALWAFVRAPLEPRKRLDLSNDLPGLKRDVRLEFDQNMTRYLDWPEGDKPRGAVRILCLGGGATFAMLQNAEDAWWGRLHAALKERGVAVQTAAWGQERGGILAAAAMADGLMEELKPDIVIGNFGFNDAVLQPIDYQYDPDRLNHAPGVWRTAGWKRALLNVSQTARVLRWQARKSEMAQVQNTQGRPDFFKEAFDSLRERLKNAEPQPGPERFGDGDPLKEFEDGWRRLKTLADRHGAALILTGEASLHDAVMGVALRDHLMAVMTLQDGRGIRPSSAWVEAEMRRFAEKAESLAREWQAPWLDLNGRVARSREHFVNDTLLTDAGAAVAAAEMLPVVEPVARGRAGK